MNPANRNILLFPSLARTATPTPAEVNAVLGGQADAYGAHIIINVTAVGVTPSVVFNVEAWDEISQTWYLLLASAALVAVAQTILKIFPGATVSANQSANDTLTNKWRVRPVHGNGVSITYSVSANLFEY